MLKEYLKLKDRLHTGKKHLEKVKISEIEMRKAK